MCGKPIYMDSTLISDPGVICDIFINQTRLYYLFKSDKNYYIILILHYPAILVCVCVCVGGGWGYLHVLMEMCCLEL